MQPQREVVRWGARRSSSEDARPCRNTGRQAHLLALEGPAQSPGGGFRPFH